MVFLTACSGGQEAASVESTAASAVNETVKEEAASAAQDVNEAMQAAGGSEAAIVDKEAGMETASAVQEAASDVVSDIAK